MKKFKTGIAVLFVMSLLWAGSNAYADIIGSSNAGWQGTNTYTVNNNGTPYWDNTSSDGTYKNIGYCLNDINCINPSPGKMPYWGKSGGYADRNFYFSGTTGSDLLTLMFEIAGLKDTNEFGWYEIDGNGSKIAGTNHEIFDGSDNAVISTIIPSLSQFYGFYFTDDQNHRTYYTQSKYNSYDGWKQHFAIFQEGDAFWIGIEDLPLCGDCGCSGGDKDYNDMIIHMTKTTTVPEPSSLALIVIGISGLGILRRFKV